MDFEEKTSKENIVYNGKILKLHNDEVILPDGKKAFREIVNHSGGSAILCEKDGKILLVRQYRYAYKQELWEIPAGKLNPGEDPEETALRELEEEGGIRAKKIEKIFTVYPSPGYTDEVIHIYRAYDFIKTEMHLDEDEFLTGEWVDKETVKKMIESGEIKDGKSLIALLSIL